MNKRVFIVMISVLAIAMPFSSAHSQLKSTFDNSDEGWTIAGNGAGGTTPNYYSTGGNPGGFIEGVDATGNASWFFVSPNSWDGNWTNYIGGSLQFNFKSFEITGTETVNNVRIYSGSNFVAWDFPVTPPLGEWTRIEVDLTSSNFDRISGTPGTTFESIMANVTALYILGDYGGGLDRGGLDNVRVTPAGWNFSRVGVFRPSIGMWFLDRNGSGFWNDCVTDGCINFGIQGDIQVTGDWNGDGTTKIGVFRPSIGWWFLDYNGNGLWDGCSIDRCYNFGISEDTPVTGDWNGDGKTEIGVYRKSIGWWFLDYNAEGTWSGCSTDRCFNFGISEDTPVTGDWNGDGKTEIGVFRPSIGWWFVDVNGDGTWSGCGADGCYNFGISVDLPVTGDWNGDGYTEIGVYRPSIGMWFLDYNGNDSWNDCTTDRCYQFGISVDLPVSGVF